MKVPFWVVLAIGVVLLGAAIFTRTIPYWVILPAVVGWLAAQHAISPAPTAFSKQVVILVTVWATVLASAWPLAIIPVILALVVVGVYILLHQDMTTPSP